ncbi:acyl carrier protein [Fastidiosipila sanguinis]|nr:phosphopantetheine-binding protein [Fastidiosipila sanguinis]
MKNKTNKTDSDFSFADIIDIVKKSIAKVSHLKYDDISLEDNLTEKLELDSLSLIELVVDLESFFDLRIAEEDLDDVQTVEDACELIESKLRN